MSLFKGIFWYVPGEHKLIAIKVKCDNKGLAQEPINYSSKSGENFNHKTEWSKLPKSITKNYPYNYYPRSRIEIRNGKATIFFNPVLNRFDIHELIAEKFGLNGSGVMVREVADGSKYDLNRLKLNLCIDCFDKVLDFILPQCKTNPLEEYHFEGEVDV